MSALRFGTWPGAVAIPRQVRRLLALAAAYDGLSRTEAAKVGGMDRQTLRDWAHRFNDEGPDGLKHRSGAGRPRLLTQEQMSELSAIVETGPDPEVDGVVRWRRIDLQRVIEERFGVIYSERTLSDLLAALSFSHISGRPQHPRQDARVIEAFKKNFPRTLAAHIAALPKTKRVEIWFQDEARSGPVTDMIDTLATTREAQKMGWMPPRLAASWCQPGLGDRDTDH